jgi:hypothetical protein
MPECQQLVARTASFLSLCQAQLKRLTPKASDGTVQAGLLILSTLCRVLPFMPTNAHVDIFKELTRIVGNSHCRLSVRICALPGLCGSNFPCQFQCMPALCSTCMRDFEIGVQMWNQRRLAIPAVPSRA